MAHESARRGLDFDPSARLQPDRLDELFRLHGLEPGPRWRAIEAAVGGLAFGAGYQRVHLGFCCAFRAYLRRGVVEPIPVTPAGEALIEIAVQGDTHYSVAWSGAVWVQDHIAERDPHLEAESLADLSERLGWPITSRLLFTSRRQDG
jgi:hypothetical protein